MSVMLVTSLGEIVIDLHTERCPLTTKNFLKLCKIKYYNHCLFHSVQKDFIAQTGDPTGKGTGGDSIYKYLYGEQARFFTDEIHSDLKHSKIGTVAMASAGENLNASQFYITLRDDLDYLDGKHTVFGEVAEGFDTLTRINEAFVDEKDRPYKNIRIKHTYILDDPFDDPPQLLELIPDHSPEPKPPEEGEEVRLEDDWVPMDEQVDPEELEKSLRKKEAHSRAVVLEMIGDIPEAEIKPPENVLFVCKLNPVTEEADLELIFSRFGNVISADIIRDYKTGDSLCYAFIEFETKEACEAAYFKMDNVLIDDRRIHVDFSQSVAKLWNQYRRAGKRPGDEAQGRQNGCYKCGEIGHIARECKNNADQAGKSVDNQQQKYVLKDTSKQAGDNTKSYDMVFEDEIPSGSEKRHHHDRGGRDRSNKDHSQSEKYERHSRLSKEERGREKQEGYKNKERDIGRDAYKKNLPNHKEHREFNTHSKRGSERTDRHKEHCYRESYRSREESYERKRRYERIDERDRNNGRDSRTKRHHTEKETSRCDRDHSRSRR
eukprot:TRINITY_DN2779_c0_g1_i1.p1 TRINITY_DN2779_c0_g1~~TRINITY_DN2779_c0_g1_i1.p1  ORF type:complete len:547 (+),score=133.27 TRINITY_DN2779_c0_g1_i1:273-1913(+)